MERTLIRMQICLAAEEFARRRRPYFVRFFDTGRKIRHSHVETYCYASDCVLEVTFYHDAPDAHPVQSPMVCFDPDDFGDEDDREPDENPLKTYSNLSSRVALLRERLEENFPECKQLDVGFMENEIMISLRLKSGFAVALPSDPSIPMFTWDRRCLIPLARATPKIGSGFKIVLPSVDGTMESFWYQRDSVTLFSSVEKVVHYADKEVFTDVDRRIDPRRHIHTQEIIAKSDSVRAQIQHLKTTFPHIKVATFTRVSHTVKVYIDLQWRCEVHLNINGTWRIVTMDPDPVVGRFEPDYLDKLEEEANNALKVSAHFIRTGRVCAFCSLTLPKKMRRCPCNAKVYYCGAKCQLEHWKDHKAVCEFKK